MADYVDDRTGAGVTDLTPEFEQAQVVYQTHPMWTPNMQYLVFTAIQDDRPSPYGVEMSTGRAKRLVDQEDIPAFTVAAGPGRLYYAAGKTLNAVSVSLGFRRMATSRQLAALPKGVVRLEGGISLDSNEKVLYAGVVFEEEKRWGIIGLNLDSCGWRMVTEVDFQVGHVQANPAISGVIMFCHETGGDAEQRMWVVNSSGKGLRPFYKETYNEWVTHEVWWKGMKALFTIWPYDEEHTQKPHGVVSADLATGTPHVHAQFPAWHVHGSADGKWIVADDMERNIWLIKADTGERRLLTQGHNGEGFETHTHPSFSPDGKSVVFTSSRTGKEHVCMAEIPAWESLPLAEKA